MTESELTDQQHEQLHALFVEVIELPEAERAAFCAASCGDDERLRTELEAMLAVRLGDDFLAEPVLSHSSITELGNAQQLVSGASDIPDPEQIGHYRIIERLGDGGMGVVYLAEQNEPIRRSVALKVIKPGMDTERVIARFDVERQALALMDHPSIARIHDSGTTTNGRPWFAMEFVDGESLLAYCHAHRMPTRARLELFAMLCDGVQHAHQKGVIHRDLKPSNVLVTDGDGKPRPVVIDFGIARAVYQQPTDRSQITRQHEMVGTVDYMAPEQADQQDQNVDSRADIYSLGVMLFELLAGERPFDSGTPARLRTPHPPSTRVGRNDTTTEAAKHQASDVRTLRRMLRGELDWITIKALETDRERRYASASEFAADVRRYLAREPVLAGPPGIGYRLRTFVRRHRVPVATGALAASALVAGSTMAVWGLVQAATQRETADTVVAMLSMSNSESLSLGRRRELLDRAASDVDLAFGSRPRAESAIREMVGKGFLAVGENDRAREQFGRALELLDGMPDAKPHELHEILWLYQWPVQMSGRENLAHSIYRRSLFTVVDMFYVERDTRELARRLTALLDERNPANYATHVDRLMELANRHLDADDPRWLALADFLSDLVMVEWETLAARGPKDPTSRWFPPVDEIHRDKVQLAPSSSRVLKVPMLHVTQLALAKRFDEALALAERTTARLDAVLPRDHDYHAWTRWAHGVSLCGLGRFDEGLPLLDEAHAILERIGDRGYATTYVLTCSIEARAEVGDVARTERLRHALIENLLHSTKGWIALDPAEAALGPEHATFLAGMREALRRCREAGGFTPELIDVAVDCRRRFGEGSAEAAIAAGPIIRYVEFRCQGPSADTRFATVLESCIAACGRSEHLRANAIRILAELQLKAGDPEAALETARRLLTERGNSVRQQFYEGKARVLIGEALTHLDRDPDLAEQYLLAGYDLLAGAVGLAGVDSAAAHRVLQAHYLRHDRFDDGVKFAHDRLRSLIRRSAEPALLLDTLQWIVATPAGTGAPAELAVEAAGKVCTLQPEQWRSLMNLGISLLRAGDPAEALVALDEAERRRAGQSAAAVPELPTFEAIALARLGRHEDASAALQRAREAGAAVSERRVVRLQLAEAERAVR